MNDELLTMVEREVLGWPSVASEPSRFNSTVYKLGRREIGHVHRDGVADLPFPRRVHDELISAGKAQPHRPGFPSFVSYYIREPEDVSGAIELFRMNYDRAKAAQPHDRSERSRPDDRLCGDGERAAGDRGAER